MSLAPGYAAIAAADALRRGQIVGVAGASGAGLALLSAELADAASLAALESGGVRAGLLCCSALGGELGGRESPPPAC